MPCGRYYSMFSLEFLVSFDSQYRVKKITMYQGNHPTFNTWNVKKGLSKSIK